MNNLKVLFMLVLAIAAGNAYANSDIVDRIKKVGEVCLEGEDCGAAAAATTEVASAGGGVEDNYNKSCATCHAAGIAGAPKLGDLAAWEPRLAKGIDTLYNSAISGLPPAMPAKGMCFSCSDDDLKALVDYMVDTVQ